MADYPTLVKSYQPAINPPIIASGTPLTDARALLWAFVHSLLTFGSVPWTCLGSSDGTTAAIDGVNRWVAPSNLVWAASGTAHSWIILKQTGVGANFQVLISCSNNSFYFLNVTMSPSAGYTGGSTTLDPTATDSVPILTNQSWGCDSGTSATYKLQVMQSTDGAVTRGLICRYGGNTVGGVVCGFVSFELPENPVTGWNFPCHGMWLGSTGANNVLTIGNLYQTYSGNGRGVSNMTMIWTVEATNGTPITESLLAPNDLNQKWQLPSVGIWSQTAANRGRHAQLFDIWWSAMNTSTGLGYWPNGAPYDGAGPYSFAQFGPLVLPWFGVPVQMS